MEYNGPFDQPGIPDAPYVNGNPATGTPGSIPPAEAFEYPQREICNFISDNLIAPDNADLHQISRAYQNAAVIYGTDTGTADAIAITLNPSPLALTPGLTVRIKKGNLANTGQLTLNIGLGIDNLLKANGAAFNTGEFPANMVFEATWDGSTWKTINFLGVQSTTQTVINNFTTNIPYTVDTSVVANTIVGPYSPVITGFTAGNLILVKLNKSFTGGAVGILVNAVPSIAVKRGDGNNPLKGDGYVGQILLLEFDGVNFQIINSNVPSGPLPIIIGDQKANGSNGGTFASGAWRTRDLNAIIADPFGLVAAGLLTLSNNRFTLAAGTWEIFVRAPAIGVDDHELRIYNITDNSIAIKGEFYDCGSAIGSGGDPSLTLAMLEGIFVLTSPKTYEVQHVCERSRASFGFGTCQGNAASAEVHWQQPTPGLETYTVVSLTWSR